MSLSFASYGTIVADSPGTYYGEIKYIGGERESEVYERSFPGSSGVFEISSGDRRAIIAVQCTWYTDDVEVVENRIDQILEEKRVGTLTVPDGVGGTMSKTFCRLISANPNGQRFSGIGPDGSDVVCFSKTLVFKKVRF